MKRIEESRKQKAIKLYENTDLTLQDISSLVGISIPSLSKLYKRQFELGVLKRRRAQKVPKVAERNAQKGTIKRRKRNSNRKFDEKQELRIAKDYYEKDMSVTELHAKWGIHPVQLQRIRNKYRSKYGIKQNAPNCYKNRD